MGHLGLRTAHRASQLWICCKDCFIIFNNGFSKRNLIQGNLVILAQKWYSVLIALDLISGFFISFAQSKGPTGTWEFF